MNRIDFRTDRLFRKLDNIQDLVSRGFETLFAFLDAWSSDPTNPIKRDLRIRWESSLTHDTSDNIPADPSRAPDVQNIPDPWSSAFDALPEITRKEFEGMFFAKELGLSGGTKAGGSSGDIKETLQSLVNDALARQEGLRYKISVSFIPSWMSQVTDIPAWITEKMRRAPEVMRYWRIVLRRMLAT